MSAQLINWQQQWYAHIHSACHIVSFNDLYRTLNQIHQQYFYSTLSKNSNQQAIGFVSQTSLPENIAYESHIYKTGNIPTRNNLHDFFNACIWFSFPNSKVFLNKQQALIIDKQGVSSKRGGLRDAITLFDENGAILITCNDKIDKAINSFSWQAGLVENRNLWNTTYEASTTAEAEVYIFGHALLEQLVTPRKPLCSHTITLKVPKEWFNQTKTNKLKSLDVLLTEKLTHIIDNNILHTKFFQPLPILGVPHFWEENKNIDFYNDDYVFRSGRRKKPD